MDIQELRIGNVVKTCTPNMRVMIPTLIASVQAINLLNGVAFCHTPEHEGFNMQPQHIMGLEITDELLIDLGFGGRLGKMRIPIKIDDMFCEMRLELDEDDKFYNVFLHQEDDFFILPIIEFKYIHQIQNLYFSLTGIELTFNELKPL